MSNVARTPVTAVLALACGLSLAGGIATAASRSTGSAKACVTKKGDLSLPHHRKCAKGTRRITLGAKGPRGAVGAPAVKYWAVVSETGALEHGSAGVTSVEMVDTTGGRNNPYALVAFPANITACAPEATIADNSNNTLTVGDIVAFPEHSLDPTNTSQVLVQVHEDGTADSVTTATAFSLTVTC